MNRKVKLDPTKIEYDGTGFKVVILDKVAFRKKIERLLKQVLKDLNKRNKHVE